MARYQVLARLLVQFGGVMYSAEAGEVIELPDEVAAWIKANKPGAISPVGAGGQRAKKKGQDRMVRGASDR